MYQKPYIHSSHKKKMTLKQFITTSYGKKIYSTTKQFQEKKIKNAHAKNQFIFLQRCISNNITPKSFRIKSPINTKKANNLTKEYQTKLLIHAKNEARRRLYESKNTINSLRTQLESVISPRDLLVIENITEKSKNYHYSVKKNKMKEKFDKLKSINQSNGMNRNSVATQSSLIKQPLLNLTNETLTIPTIELLNLGPKFVPSYKKVPIMDILTSIESCAMNLESKNKNTNAEVLRQNTNKILSKSLKI